MHTTRSTLTLLLSALPAGLAADEPSAAQAEVLEFLGRAKIAVMGCRMDEYASAWAEGGHIFISSGDPLMDADAYLETWRGVCAGGGGIEIGSAQEEVTLLGDDAALVTGTVGYVFTAPDGTAHSGTTRTSTIVRRINGEWKLFHAHGSELGHHGGLEE